MANTANKDLQEPAYNSFVNSWDTPVNSNTSILDAAFGSSTSLNATGLSGNQTLSASQYQPFQLIVAGLPLGTTTYVVPAGVGGFWVFENATSGGFTIGIKSAAGGSTITVAAGFRTFVACDGTANGMKLCISTSVTAGGSNTQIQYNGAGVLSGSSSLTWDGTKIDTTGLTVNGNTILGSGSGSTTRINGTAVAIPNNLNFNSNTLFLEQSTGRVGIGIASALADLLTVAGTIRSTTGGIVFPDGSTQTTAAGSGGASGSTNWVQYNNGGSFSSQSNFTFVAGTGVLSVPVISASGTITAGSSITASTFVGTWNGTAISVAKGGTGLTGTPSNGQLPIGNSTGYTLATLTAGSGISITNGGGSITITATGSGGTVTSVNASGGSSGLSFTGGPITTSGTLTINGTLAAASGGTGVDNGSSTITLVGSFSTTGSGSLSFGLSGITSLVLPTSGTLLTTAGNGSALTGITSSQISGLAASATTNTTNASNITSGTLSVNRFNSGTGASSSTYLSGAGTWTTPATGVSGGGAGQIPVFNSATTITTSTYLTISGSVLNLNSSGTGAEIGLGGSTSGSTTLKPSATASGTLTLPAATDTLVGRSTTDTLSNKTLVAPVLGAATGTSLSVSATLQTGAPSGASAGLWKLGSLVTAAVTADTTRYIAVDIGGVVYKLIVAT